MTDVQNPLGPTRTNLAQIYQSGKRPEHGEDPNRLPVKPTTGQPLPPVVQPGYYPGYHTLSQQAFWDEATRREVLNRVNNVPPIRFFAPDEERVMRAVVDRIIPQDDRVAATRIPILPAIDKRLYDNVMDGYRFEGMPPDQEVFRLGIKGIQAIARKLFDKSFEELQPGDQDQVLVTLHDGNPVAGHEYWDQMTVTHFWQMLVQDCIEGYYAHPYAWDEIGFGGPAYPRGYMRLEHGVPEPWEVEEQRYGWAPPPGALSAAYTPIGREAGTKTPTPGQEGTH
jgi:hypothetical protein